MIAPSSCCPPTPGRGGPRAVCASTTTSPSCCSTSSWRTDDAGLQVARFIRQELQNQAVRVVLRTGQPGTGAGEKQIIRGLRHQRLLVEDGAHGRAPPHRDDGRDPQLSRHPHHREAPRRPRQGDSTRPPPCSRKNGLRFSSSRRTLTQLSTIVTPPSSALPVPRPAGRRVRLRRRPEVVIARGPSDSRAASARPAQEVLSAEAWNDIRKSLESGDLVVTPAYGGLRLPARGGGGGRLPGGGHLHGGHRRAHRLERDIIKLVLRQRRHLLREPAPATSTGFAAHTRPPPGSSRTRSSAASTIKAPHARGAAIACRSR